MIISIEFWLISINSGVPIKIIHTEQYSNKQMITENS